MSRSAGYTEAELLALEWSKQNKKKYENKPENNDLRRRRSESRSRNSSSAGDRYYGNRSFSDRHNSDRRNYERNNIDRHGSERRGNESRQSEWNNGESSHYRSDGPIKNREDRDEFGRVVSSRREYASQHSSSSSYRARSRSRSRSRSPLRRRAYEDEIKHEAPKENGRREKQKDLDSSWSHDKYDDDDNRYVNGLVF